MAIIRAEDGALVRVESNGVLVQHFDRGRLHCADGPAVSSRAGTRWFYWRGVRVPRLVIEDPRSVSVETIWKVENVEVRRAWLESYGLEQALTDLRESGRARVIHKTSVPERALWELDYVDVDDRKPRYVQVTCPSTGRVYFLRVHPDHSTCEAAVASTFKGVSVGAYAQALES